MDLKVELGRRANQSCTLCGWKCSVNRFQKEGPYCGLKADVYHSVCFVHVAEEPQITPCYVVRLNGCALRCKHCQAHDNFDFAKGKKLDERIWKELGNANGHEKAVALQFPGGNSDESVYPILETLNAAPESFDKPIVWNANGYANKISYRIQEGVVDVYLTDFKYGNNECGREVSGVLDYWDVAREGLEEIVKQNVRIIIRILILPGHTECCCEKILEHLGGYRERIWVSIIDNYVPDWKALNDPKLNRLVSSEEIERVHAAIRKHGLRDVNENPNDFWRS